MDGVTVALTRRSIAHPMAAAQATSVRRRGIDATTMLTVYLVLLFAVPSNVGIAILGSLGRPSFLWGLCLLAWWSLARLQAPSFSVRPVWQPAKLAYGALIVIALVSLAASLLRGQPFDQISPAVTGVLRLLSWGGVMLVAMDGIRTVRELSRVLRRVVIAGALLAALGIAQFVTGQNLIEIFGALPGMTGVDGGVDARGSFTRSSGTATHPLEYATALSAVLPLAVAAAIGHGFHPVSAARRVLWWVPVGAIGLASFLAVSRSAVVGIGVALIALIPGLPRRTRMPVIIGASALAAIVVVAVPGLLGTMVGLFSSAGSDASTTSRVNALDRAPLFVSTSPVYGNGFGTFLPRYYIFDNQWVLLAVELGVLGVLTVVALFVAGVWSSLHAARVSIHTDVPLIGHALVASLVTVAVLFGFFDGLSFPIAAALPFLLVGLAGAVRTVGAADRSIAARAR